MHANLCSLACAFYFFAEVPASVSIMAFRDADLHDVDTVAAPSQQICCEADMITACVRTPSQQSTSTHDSVMSVACYGGLIQSERKTPGLNLQG